VLSLMMKTIMEPKGAVVKMWGVPKKTGGQTYRLMHYILRNQCEDGTLLYNVVTSELVLLDPETDLDSLFPGEYRQEMDELIQHHFAVPQDYDEKKSVDQLRVILRALNKPKHIKGYTIYPTTCCNARCFYCFESGFAKETMTTGTADAVVKYILEHSGGKPIEIEWFGGEPLVGKHIITYICERLNENGVEFKSTMVSNAYLFDTDTAKTAADLWKVKEVQITLDGTEEVYNTTKAYQNVQGSPYRKVLDNIELILNEKISVSVRLNVTQNNIENLFLLEDELRERFSGKKDFQVYGHMVYEAVGYDPVEYADDVKECLYDKIQELRNKLIQDGLSYGYSRHPGLKHIKCMADNDGCVTVFPNGFLGKCENSPQNEAFASVFGDCFKENIGRCKEYEQFELCNGCQLYPDCLHLSICPEYGKCTRKRANDLIEGYTGNLVHMYQQSKAREACSNDEKEVPLDCGKEI